MVYRVSAKIACRVMAVYFFLKSMYYLPNLFVSIILMPKTNPDINNEMLPYTLTGVIPLIIAILIWVFADAIAKAIVKDVPEASSINVIDYNNIAIITFTAIGLFVLTSSIPELVRLIFLFKQQNAMQMINPESRIYMDYISKIVGESIKTVLSIWLLLGSKGIVKLIKLFRNLGTNSIEHIEE